MKVLRNKNGASLIFVMAAMLFLLALGTAAFTAAGLNHGVNAEQRDQAQLELYVSSMERTFQSLLAQAWIQPDVSIEEDYETLGGQIMMELYRNGSVDMTFFTEEMNLSGKFADESVKYTATITSKNLADMETFTFFEKDYIRCESYDGVTLDRECEPLEIEMRGELILYLRTEYTTPSGDKHLSMDTMTTFRVRNILLQEEIVSDCEDGGWYSHRMPDVPPLEENMIIVNEAVWEVIRHEKPRAESVEDPD